MQYDSFITHNIHMFMGKPKSGKTLIAGSYPKPLLYISVGNDGGGRVLSMMYKDDVAKGNIKVKNLANDRPVNGKIQTTSIEKLTMLFAELRKPDADKFKTIVIDTVGALQDDYKSYMEYTKGKSLSQSEWGEVATMMMTAKNVMKRFSEEMGVIIVWVCHTRDYELTETSGLDKEMRIIPDLTINTGVKYMKDASNIFYCCRKTCYDDKGQKITKFLTFIGPHPLMDTGTRDIPLKVGEFVEDFTYDKFMKFVESGKLEGESVAVPKNEDDENKIENSEE